MTPRGGRSRRTAAAHPLLRPLVFLVAVHSWVVGLCLLLVPGWSLAIGGFTDVASTFFVRQGGVFHLVVATGYVLEHRRHGTVTLLVVAKAAATLFLAAAWTLGEARAWSVLLSAIGDGLMGLAAWYLVRAAAGSAGDPGAPM